MKNLVIVESPSKAKTIEKYLGRNYKVVASMGHVLDLPKSVLGIDVENGFKPKYLPLSNKRELIKELAKTAKESDTVYLATDPDREGEAISWHLKQALKLGDDKAKRVTFNEITKNTVLKSIKAPRKIDEDLVDAYQARRALDRIVGYKVSPLLWKTIKRGLSAGRVQSVTVRLVVLREREIKDFVSKEYWAITVVLKNSDGSTLKAKFVKYAGDATKTELTSKEQTDEVLSAIQDALYRVSDIRSTQKHRYPAPPFITSTLQQEASRRLGFSSKKTMMVAQNLYEGVSLGDHGMAGLITYMRTDSLRLSTESTDSARSFILDKFGEDYLPEKARAYKSKGNVQDAHEAIRPSDPKLTPAWAKEYLTADQYKLYKLIWERFTASQMTDAVYNTVAVDIDTEKAGARSCRFRANGSIMVFPGFTALYEDTKEKENEKQDDNEEQANLPQMKLGETLYHVKTLTEQKFTQPPQRYNEATLIKALEENGIGRPSTYAPTISTILDRKYVEKEGRYLKPTELGNIVTELMEANFGDIVDVEFTANMEDKLDSVSEGEEQWVNVISGFYSGFIKELKSAEERLKDTKIKIEDEVSDVICEKCGRNMVIKSGRFGKFLACPGYPECKNAKPIVIDTGGKCPLCGGKLLQKKSKNGRVYYGCENNMKCTFMTWDIPVKDKCPTCGKTLYMKKQKDGNTMFCADPACNYRVKVEKNNESNSD